MGGSCDCGTMKRLIPASHFLPDASIGLWWNEEDAVIEIEIVVSELACGLGSSQLQRRLLGKTTSWSTTSASSDSADRWWDWSVAPNYRPSGSHVQNTPVHFPCQPNLGERLGPSCAPLPFVLDSQQVSSPSSWESSTAPRPNAVPESASIPSTLSLAITEGLWESELWELGSWESELWEPGGWELELWELGG